MKQRSSDDIAVLVTVIAIVIVLLIHGAGLAG